MVKVINSKLVSISELQEKQIQWLRDALATVKFINNNSLADAQKKEGVINNLARALNLEKDISLRLVALERAGLDYLSLTKDAEAGQRIKTSLPFLTKYQVENWLNKISNLLQENNYTLVIRTLEEELLDSYFGMMAGRMEHTKLVEQRLPLEELQEAQAYNSVLQQLKDTFDLILTKNQEAQFKEGINGLQLVQEFQAKVKNLLGKGFLFWKSGMIPEIEAHYQKDEEKLKESNLFELDGNEIQQRQSSLTRLEGGLMEVSQAAFHLLEANVVYTPEQLEQTKNDLADTFIAFQTRAFNLIVPPRQRNELRPSLINLSGYFNRVSKIETESSPSLPSDIPEFVYELFTTMEDLAKGAKQKADENDYKEAVLRIEEIYRLTLRREWERLKKPPVSKVSTVLLERNNNIQNLVQIVRNVVRNPEDREKQFSHLILSLEQTNQLLAARRGVQ
ncbi:MAG: hypothetical protein WCV90_03710 [Candidatus Woesearchaeota archaeon]|jgi:hypothetical protein